MNLADIQMLDLTDTYGERLSSKHAFELEQRTCQKWVMKRPSCSFNTILQEGMIALSNVRCFPKNVSFRFEGLELF